MAPDVRRPIDRLLLFFALTLMAVGMVWVFSASAFKSQRTATTFLVTQLMGGGIGVAIMLALSQVDLNTLRDNPRVLQVLYMVALVLLGAVFLFPPVNHAHRWIRLSRASIQPSELFKPLSVLITAWWMVRHREAWASRQDSIPKLLALFAILMVPLGLVLREPDFGTTFLILFVALLVTFLGGAPRWIFAVVAPALGAVGAAFVWSSYSLLTKRVRPFGTGAVGGFCLASGLLALALHALAAPATPAVSPRDWLFLVLLGLGPMGLAFYTWDAAMKRGDPRVIGALAYLTPLLSTLVLVLFGGRRLTALSGCAMGLIVAGAVVGSLDLFTPVKASSSGVRAGRKQP